MYAASRSLLAGAGLFAALALATPAHAAGPPLPSSESGKAGVVAPGGTERLLTRRVGTDTVVTAVRLGSGAVDRSRRIAGHWAIPAVALDGSTTGLSADGGTLVLARPASTSSYPPTSTRLAVLDARTLTVRREIALDGFFTVDAVAPDGATVGLIHYASEDPFDYRVRALDTRTGRLAERDIVDPREPDERMGGLPWTRVMSPDGRWAYTLYGGGDETFIHALNTAGRTAACIDLEMLAPQEDLSRVRLRLSPDGRRLDVRDGSELVASVDARTFAVSEPGEAAPAATREPATRRDAVAPPGGDDSGVPWPALLLAAAVLVGAAGLVTLRRRRPLSR
jgi:hypothetical protein